MPRPSATTSAAQLAGQSRTWTRAHRAVHRNAGCVAACEAWAAAEAPSLRAQQPTKGVFYILNGTPYSLFVFFVLYEQRALILIFKASARLCAGAEHLSLTES